MASCATTYLEAGRSWEARVAERNAELMAQQPLRRRGARTPEVPFAHNFDNSRLVKAADPLRVRQMRVFSAAITVFLSLVMAYGLQHFNAIESGYRVESEKQALDQLREENRQLKLSEAQLTQPDRIDRMARELGLVEPQPGQVVHPNTGPNPGPDAGTPVLAQANAPVIPAQ
jgi:cell division protein FtsL